MTLTMTALKRLRQVTGLAFSLCLASSDAASIAQSTSPARMRDELSTKSLRVFVASTNRAGTGSREEPFNDIGQALHFVQLRGAMAEVILLPGIYKQNSVVSLVGNNAGLTLRAERDGTVVLDGQGQLQEGITVHGMSVRIRGLQIRNYLSSGITIQSARNVTISGNLFSNISTKKWNGGAVHGIHRVSGLTVEENVIVNSGFGGIVMESSSEGTLDHINVKSNKIYNSCLNVVDCGAIYIGGRSSQSTNNRITDNEIYGFGKKGRQSKAIYLDDGLGDSIVSHNTVFGQGDYIIQIHGGGGNTFYRNKFKSSSPLLLYQGLSQPQLNHLKPNTFRANIYSNRLVRREGENLPNLIFDKVALRRQSKGL